MSTKALYERLAEHFNHFIVGAPRTDTLIRILQILFPPEEAEVALHMPVLHKMTLAELQTAMSLPASRLPVLLDRMAARGTLQVHREDGPAVRYALLPSAKGWYDTPYWDARRRTDRRRLAPLWLQYREEAFGAELARGDMPTFRTVPVGRALKHDTAVLPFDRLGPQIQDQAFIALSPCPCRQIKNAVGEGCGRSLEVCFNFGSLARHLVDQGMGREVSVAQTLEIVRACEEEGLVHCVENIDGYLGTLCNCCACCCLFIDTRKRLGYAALASSVYRAEVNPQACRGCGECLPRCPMDAIVLSASEVAVIDPAACLGCGHCAAVCETAAINLRRGALPDRPPDLAAFLARKLKTA
ncbi:MAG: 4Fe-4S dicluster domain-containing protein [Desulfobacterales bacterium]|nr:4Fe-4S dicluster domain-containing protein [Desulfobacterales bacterium]